MKRSLRRAVLLAIPLTLCWAPAGALAAPAPASSQDAERAEALVLEGAQAFEERRFDDAYRAHREAWRLHPSFKTAAGLAQVELHLQKYRDAAEHLSYALRRFPPDGSATLRQQLDQGLSEARAQVGALRVRVNVEGAEVSVDGKSVGAAPLDGLVFVEPGTHELRASLAGYEPAVAQVAAVKSGVREVALSLAPVGKPAEADTPSGAGESGISTPMVVLIVGGTLSIGSAAALVGFSLHASSAEDDMQAARAEIGSSSDTCSNPASEDASLCRELADKRDDRNRAQTFATVSAVAAGVFAAATVALYFVLDSKEDTEQSALFFSPAAGPGFAGFSASARF